MQKIRLKLIIIAVCLFIPLVLIHAQDDRQPGNIVLAIQGGTAQVSYAGGGTAPLEVGATLTSSDIVIPDGFSSVFITCADGSPDVINNERAPSCRADVETPVATVRGYRVIDRVQRSIGEVLYVISPRNTRLLDTTPDFIWTPVDGAVSYTVRVKLTDASVVWEVRNLKETVLPYPENTYPPLRALDGAGNTLQYLVEVLAFDRAGNSIGRPDSLNLTPLKLATPTERPEIESILSEIDALELPEEFAESRAYLRANFLYQKGFYAAALEALEPLVTDVLADMPEDLPQLTGIRGSSELYLLLGDIYAAISLPVYARPAYERALAIAESGENLNSQAIAHLRLVPFSENRMEQRTRYEESLRLFTESGNEEGVALVTEEIGE